MAGARERLAGPSVTQGRWSCTMLSKLLILSTTYFTKKNIISNLPDALRGTELQRAGDSRILPATAPIPGQLMPSVPTKTD